MQNKILQNQKVLLFQITYIKILIQEQLVKVVCYMLSIKIDQMMLDSMFNFQNVQDIQLYTTQMLPNKNNSHI